MSNSNKTKQEMQKGLSSLLGNIQKNPSTALSPMGNAADYLLFANIPLASIAVNPNNPRSQFDAKALEELAASIRTHGLIQPITVLRLAKDKYQIIAGERRFRAAKLAGLAEVPAYIRKANDNDVVEWAIIENLQRENLNPIELALGLQRMVEEMNYTQEQVAERVGKDRSTVANTIRLLKLPPDVQLALKENKISAGHARAIINVEHIDLQLQLLREIESKALSVRQTEQAVKNLLSAKKTNAPSHKKNTKDIHTQKLEEELTAKLQSKVNIDLPAANKLGNINISFKSIKDLNDICERMFGKTKR